MCQLVQSLASFACIRKQSQPSPKERDKKMANTQTETKTAKAKAKPKPDRFKAMIPASNKEIAAIGPEVLKLISDFQRSEAKIAKLGEQVVRNKYETAAKLTQAVYQIAHDNSNLDLEAFYSGDKTKVNNLTDQLRILLGVQEVKEVKTKSASGRSTVRKKLVYTPAVKSYFPKPGMSKEEKAKPDNKRKASIASNFSQSLKMAGKAVLGMLEHNAIPEYSAEHATLIVKGAPKMIAGATSEPVVLKGETQEGAETSASIKSFTRLADDAHGVAPATKGRESKPADVANAALKSEDAFGALCNSLVIALNKHTGKWSEAEVKHIATVKEAIAKIS